MLQMSLRALQFVRHLKWRILGAQLLMVVGSLLGLAMPLILGALFDGTYPYQWLLMLLVGAGIAAAVINYFKSIAIGQVSNSVALTLRHQVYEKLQALPYRFFTGQNTGDLLSIVVNDINLFKEALSTGVLYLAEMGLSFVAVVVIMLSIDPILTLVLALALPVKMLVSRRVARPVDQVSATTQRHLSEITDILNQSISGIEVIQSFSLQSVSRAMFGRANTSWFRSISRLLSLKAKNGFFLGIINILELSLIIGVGFYRIGQGALTLGTLTSFVLYAEALAGPIGMLSSLYVDVKAAFAAMRRVFRILDMPGEPTGAHTLLSEVSGEIVFEDVSFTYGEANETQRPVLDRLSMRIKAGQRAALVGESGAGKTTIMNLILSFLRPTGGRITLDGMNLTDVDTASLRRNIAVVSQNPYIFDLSIGDNIRCGNPDASDEAVIAAAKAANAHEFISQCAQGYDTIAGEKGMMLSGGQRQRIALARAFLKDAPILLLDEATSALDNFSEQKVQSAVERLMHGRTTITVAHRLSTIIGSDVIFYIKDGNVLASGTHSELLAHCEEYQHLYRTSLGASKRKAISLRRTPLSGSLLGSVSPGKS